MNHQIVEDYREDKKLRNEFYKFVAEIFPSADFKEWYSLGFWAKDYIPHSIIEDRKIITNVSISKMNLIINGNRLGGIQFGTVGTIPEYRNKGYSRILMEYVLDKYKHFTDFWFLFANEDVLDFYTKFGFIRFDEFIFEASSNIPKPEYSARRLDIKNKSDLELVKTKIKTRLDLTRRFGAKEFDFITFWHILNIFPENLIYLEAEDIICIVKEDKEILRIYDVIFSQPIDLSLIIHKIFITDKIKSIIYYFPPDQLHFKYDKVIRDESSFLFIKGNFNLQNKYIKFPTTAQT